jgi:hypothetical protein
VLLQLHTFSFEASWLKELDVAVALSTSIITYNNTHSVRVTRCTRMVSRRHLPAEGRVGICGSLIGTGTCFSPIILFSPVSIFPPIVYTQPFIYHQNYVTLPTDSVIKWHTHTKPKLWPKLNIHQHQHRQSAQWTAICRPEQLLERSVPQHYTATYRSQYYRAMTWTDFSHPTRTLPLEGCRVSWYRQLQNANRSVLSSIKRTKTLFYVG